MPRALVTGGSGFLGLHLSEALERGGYEVHSLDVMEPPPSAPAERRHVRADVRDADAVRRAAEGCDVVVDNAALVPVTRASEAEYRSVNVDGCRNTLEAAAAAGAYALHISSSAIFGVPRELPVRPDTELAPFEPYGRSKADADRLVAERRASGQAVASLRPRTLLGAGRLGLFDVIFSRVRAGKAVPMFGRGHNRVQMCDVEDFCAAALAAIERRASGDYNIGAPEFGSVREDLAALIRHAGTDARLVPVPVAAIKAVLVPLAAIGRSPFNEWHWRSAPKPFYFDIGKARGELGWEPRRSNAEALANAYEHYVERTDAGGSAHLQPLRGTLARLLRG
jgi:nucleoside-diphosphate-sugar epimerase